MSSLYSIDLATLAKPVKVDSAKPVKEKKPRSVKKKIVIEEKLQQPEITPATLSEETKTVEPEKVCAEPEPVPEVKEIPTNIEESRDEGDLPPNKTKIVRKPRVKKSRVTPSKIDAEEPPAWFKKFQENIEKEKMDLRPTKQIKMDHSLRAKQRWEEPLKREQEKIQHMVDASMDKMYNMIFGYRKHY